MLICPVLAFVQMVLQKTICKSYFVNFTFKSGLYLA